MCIYVHECILGVRVCVCVCVCVRARAHIYIIQELFRAYIFYPSPIRSVLFFMQCVAVCCSADRRDHQMQLQVSFAEYRLFYRALLQKRPMSIGEITRCSPDASSDH